MAIEQLQYFISRVTSPYHTVQEGMRLLKDKGFQELHLHEEWQLTAGNYMCSLYGTALVAFHIGEDSRHSLRLVIGHSDFPALRVKPNPTMKSGVYGTLNVEPYGGAILNTWFDRPLSMAGVIVTKGKDAFSLREHVVDFKVPLMVVPNLAIHMNPKVNDGITINKQKEVAPLWLSTGDGDTLAEQWNDLLAKEVGVAPEDILSYDLNVYNLDASSIVGAEEEFLSAPRLDNLTSCLGCLHAIGEATDAPGIRVAVLFDHEEIGSRTKQGGASTLLASLLERIYESLGHRKEAYRADLAKATVVSVDVAHGAHPNYMEKMDPTNAPVLNKGVVLKISASQHSASDALSMGMVKVLCEEAGVPYQIHTKRSDASGGSTVGSIVAAQLGARTVDVGVPILAMHSSRELMGVKDQEYLHQFLTRFLQA